MNGCQEALDAAARILVHSVLEFLCTFCTTICIVCCRTQCVSLSVAGPREPLGAGAGVLVRVERAAAARLADIADRAVRRARPPPAPAHRTLALLPTPAARQGSRVPNGDRSVRHSNCTSTPDLTSLSRAYENARAHVHRYVDSHSTLMTQTRIPSYCILLANKYIVTLGKSILFYLTAECHSSTKRYAPVEKRTITVL